MKKSLIILMCGILTIGMFGCGNNSKQENSPDISSNSQSISKQDDVSEQYKNLEKSLKSKNSNVESLSVENYTAIIKMKYCGNKDSTMKEMVTVEVMADDFFKNHKITNIDFLTENNGYIKLELKNDKYEIIDATLQ